MGCMGWQAEMERKVVSELMYSWWAHCVLNSVSVSNLF
jgi:hypothetical protein